MKIIVAHMLLFIAVASALAAGQGHENYAIAIDANGKRYVATEGTMSPWKLDALFARKPEYPYDARSHHEEGVVVIRLDIDLKTGTSTYATLIQSSGSKKLDESAFRALARWRFKPGRWKQLEIPIVFTMHGPPPEPPGPGHP